MRSDPVLENRVRPTHPDPAGYGSEPLKQIGRIRFSRRSDPNPDPVFSRRLDPGKPQPDPKPWSPLSVPKIELPDALMDMQTLFAGFNLLLWFREGRV